MPFDWLMALSHVEGLNSKRPLKTDASADKDEAEAARRAGRGFASVLYGQLFQEMQRAIPKEEDEEEDAAGIGESAQDFLGMYLPIALANQRSDPVARSIEQYLRTQYGDQANERD